MSASPIDLLPPEQAPSLRNSFTSGSSVLSDVAISQISPSPPIASPRPQPARSRSGFLWKLNRGTLWDSWEERWFLLTGSCLYYFKHGRSSPSAALPLRQLTATPASALRPEETNSPVAKPLNPDDTDPNDANAPLELSFALSCADTKLAVRAASRSELVGWLLDIAYNLRLLLNATSPDDVDVPVTEDGAAGVTESDAGNRAGVRAIELQDGRAPRLSAPPSELLSEQKPIELVFAPQDVMREASTGDLLLFASQGLRGSFIRSVTRASYDHLGLVLRYEDGRVGVLEALGNTGVQVNDFRGFLEADWHLQYKRIALRRLHFPASDEVAGRIEAFTRAVTGRKYSWSLVAAMRSRTRGATRPDATLPYTDERRCFSCADLVAECYKVAGFLRGSMPATAYVPGSFGEKNNLILLNGASLGPEILIQFPKK